MIRMARFCLGAGTLAWASVIGCVFSADYDSAPTGQGGSTTTATTSTGDMPCSLPDMPCDDGNPCTQDTCDSGFCVSTKLSISMGPGTTECITISCQDGKAQPPKIHQGESCGVGLTCTAQGECGGCTSDGQCGKTDACQKSTCQKTSMTCLFEFVPFGTKLTKDEDKLVNDKPGDCQKTICNGSGLIALANDDMDKPTDLAICMEAHCVDGKAMKSPAAVGTACASGATYCNASQMCVECALDTNCPAGSTCYQEAGCVSCGDGKKNGDETDVDCGGPCPTPCTDKQGCALDKDCKNGKCENKVCISCFDGIKNGDEQQSDCGGLTCNACLGGTCTVPGGCVSGFCADKVCCDTACTDPCKSCSMAGQCTNDSLGYPDAACPASTPVCQTGACVADGGKKHMGDMCSASAECFSGVCQGMPKTCK